MAVHAPTVRRALPFRNDGMLASTVAEIIMCRRGKANTMIMQLLETQFLMLLCGMLGIHQKIGRQSGSTNPC